MAGAAHGLRMREAETMRWFAFQRSPGGGRVPVAFDEHPKLTPTMARDVIEGTLRPIPEAMRGASLAELVEWAKTG